MSDSHYQPMDASPAPAVRVAVLRDSHNNASSSSSGGLRDGPLMGPASASASPIPPDEFRRELDPAAGDRIISGGHDDPHLSSSTRVSRRGGAGKHGDRTRSVRLSRVACALWTVASVGAVAALLYLALRVDSLQSQLDDARHQPPAGAGAWTPPVLTDATAYATARADLVARNFDVSMSRTQVLSDTEARADALLSSSRSAWLNSTGYFPTSQYFYDVRDVLEQSPLFDVFQRMPKGALLHVHTGSLGAVDYIVRNLTYRPHCYVLLEPRPGTSDIRYSLDYFPTPAAVPHSGWHNMSSARALDPHLDSALYLALTMSSADSPCNVTTNSVFPTFDLIFARVGLLHHVDAFRDYYMDGFERLVANGVQYVEVRAGIGGLRLQNGTRLPSSYTVQLFGDMRQELRARYAAIAFDFHLILSYNRAAGVDTVDADLREAFALKVAYPDLVVGFDLVSYEDAGHTTAFFQSSWILHQQLQTQYQVQLPLFFHAGESDEPNDTNIFDALVAGTRRIGHGFDLFRFGYLEQVCTRLGVAIEVCPLSNQILGYVADVRIHPAAGYIARGVPVVLSSDDPGIFGYVGMGYDFLVAYVAWGLDLRAVKQLLQNSLTYAAMPDAAARQAAQQVLSARWDAWIDSVVANPPLVLPPPPTTPPRARQRHGGRHHH